MGIARWRSWAVLGAGCALVAAALGCYNTPSAHTQSRNYSLRGDLPVDPPGGQLDRRCIGGRRGAA